MADMWVPLRAGSDIVFLGALVNYVLDARPRLPRLRRRLHQRVRRSSTRTFAGTEDLDGLFSGWDAEDEAALRHDVAGQLRARRTSGRPKRDPTLQHPRSRLPDPEAALRALHAGDGRRACAAFPRDSFVRDRRRVLPRVRPRTHRRDLLRRRPDAAFGRRADHPHRRDPAAAARQHRPARRRHPRAARPRVDSGIDRHPDALRPPARLSADAGVRRGRSRRSTATSARIARTTGWWANFDKYIVSPAEGVVRRRGDRARTSSASAGCRASPAITRTRLLARHGRRHAWTACS